MFNLFNSLPENTLLYQGAYNPVLVVLSILVAIFASYASLKVAQHVTTIAKTNVRRLWMVGGGLCLGLGVWAMHFVGMLAFSLPCTSNYDPAITFLSMFPSILASILAIKTISQRNLSPFQLATGGLLIGMGIGAMHYSGMAAMHLNGMILYDAKLFFLSIVVAVVLSTVALWIKFGLKSWKTSWNNRATIVSAMVMGLAVSGMHYTAMAAAYFINNGDTTNFATGISPAYLASNVLVATCLIIVITLVATYYHKHPEFTFIRSYKLIASLILGWVFISWYGAEYFFNQLGEDLLNKETVRANEKLNNITNNIKESLELLKGSAQVLAHDPETIRKLHRFGKSAVPSTLDYKIRKQIWTKDKALAGLSSSLDFASPRFGAELILIVNAAGDCVASSNFDKAETLVGMNFADRTYFKQARSGLQGQQYAVGRATNIPGLFFSSPVYESGRFIGAVVVKRNVSKLANWTKQANVYITDANGVIVMAPEKQFEFRYMPNASVATLSAKDRSLLYKRSELEPFKLAPWGNLPSVVLIDGKLPPVIFSSQILIERAITIYVHTQLSELERLSDQRYWLFLLLATAGIMMIIAVSAIFIFMRESQKLNAELRIAASAFESEEGILVTDANNKILQVNRAFTAITGYSSDEVNGQDPRILGSDKHSAEFFSAMWDSLVNTGTWKGEIWNRRKSGEVYPGNLIITAVKNSNGEVINYISTFSDITERKQSEELLRKSAEEIEDLYNHAPCGYHSLDKNGVIQRINDTELQWLGYTREEVVGKLKISDLLTPSSKQAFQKNFILFKKHGFIRDFENEMVRKDGSILYGLVNSTIILDAANEYLSSRSSVFDITDRKRTEVTLRSLFAALEHSPIAVIITDSDANVIYVSPRFTEVTGYPAKEVMGANLRILQAGHIDKSTYLGMWSALSDGKSWHGEIFNKTKQGREYWENVQISPVKTTAGEVSNYVFVSEEISNRKASEEKMRHLATSDPLTNLPNRSLIYDRLQQALSVAKRDKTRMALMFLDLDKFKPINDTLGHDVGDMLLKEASKRMQDCVRESDTVGRIGGDEFVVLLPMVDTDQDAILVAEKIRHALNQPFVLAGSDLHISSSIGLAIYPEHGEDAGTMVKNADTAMYYAKEAGRNNVQLFKPEMRVG